MSHESAGRVRGVTGEQIDVLYVDDNPDFLALAADMLEQTGDRLAVHTESSVSAALKHGAIDTADCIVSDYQMPGQDGLEFLETIRAEHPDLPFILFTGRGSESVASDAISAGATDYLQKEGGIDQFTVLADRMGNAVERARAKRGRQRHLTAIEQAHEGISILDADGRFMYVNDAYAELYGREPTELVGEHWELVYPDEQVQFIREEVLPTVEAEGYWHGRTTGRRADGTTFPEDHIISATDRGELVCTIRDVSEQTEWEQQLTRFRTLVETLDDPVYVLDETGRFEYVNSAFVEMVGYDKSRILGARPELIKDEDSVERAEANLGRVLSDDGPEHVRVEVTIEPREGDSLVCEDHMAVFPYEGEAFDGSVGILRDISDRKAREQRLERQNERLEEFTSIVSHDLQNPLQVAEGRVELAREDCASPHLADAQRALERSQTLIDDLLTLAREGQELGTLEAVSLPKLARESWQTVETEDATLAIETDRELLADRSRLKQLLENLVRNAVQYGGEGVTVTVGEFDGGVYVADDGPGIPPDEREAVLDPGYTTGESGTGFGLAIVARIAEAHDWDLRVTDSADGGARFEFDGVDLPG